MNRLAISLLATVAALAATSARAETRVSFGISLGAPIFYPAPPPVVVYAPPPPVVYAPPVVVYPAPAPRFAPVRVVPPGHYYYPGAVRRVYHHPYGYVPAPVHAHPYRGPCR
jgi:hypothetical protein